MTRASSPRKRILRRDPKDSMIDHIMLHVDKTDSCWIWMGGKDGRGYGLTYDGGRKIKVHMAVYRAFIGHYDRSLDLHHTCEVKHCCNPEHLKPLTRAQHIAVTPNFSQRAKTACKNGHPFTPDNTYLYRGSRCCRECNRMYTHRRRIQKAMSTKTSQHDQLKGKQKMKKSYLAVFLLLVAQAALPQSKPGKWLDTTADTLAAKYFYVGDGKLLITEDYEVVRTHEVCASLHGYFMEKSQMGRYDVNFKGMRTSATFIFTTQYDAEKWVEKWCTPESLLSIQGGRGSMKREY